MYLIKCCSDLKSVYIPIHTSRMNEEHYKLNERFHFWGLRFGHKLEISLNLEISMN